MLLELLSQFLLRLLEQSNQIFQYPVNCISVFTDNVLQVGAGVGHRFGEARIDLADGGQHRLGRLLMIVGYLLDYSLKLIANAVKIVLLFLRKLSIGGDGFLERCRDFVEHFVVLVVFRVQL